MKHSDLSNHPVLKVLLSRLRNKETPSDLFCKIGYNFNSVLASVAVSQLSVDSSSTIETPLTTTTNFKFSEKPVLIPILRAGLSMLEPFNDLLTATHGSRPENGFLAISRDEKTAQSSCHYAKVPNLQNKTVIVLDPMLATGGSAKLTLDYVYKQKPSNVYMVCVLAAPEGIELLGKQSYPNFHLITGHTDLRLNSKAFIFPGLGDYGDRFFNS